jgi:hypothetical protein
MDLGFQPDDLAQRRLPGPPVTNHNYGVASAVPRHPQAIGHQLDDILSMDHPGPTPAVLTDREFGEFNGGHPT